MGVFKVVHKKRKTEAGWRWATTADVTDCMEKVRELLEDKQWHICALVDGSVAGPGYGYEIKYEVQENLDDKLLIENEFQVVDSDHPEDGTWKKACINDVRTNMLKIKGLLADKKWYICALADGSVSGPGYLFEVDHKVRKLDHKLLIRCPIQFEVVCSANSVRPGWRIATVEDVQAHMDKVKKALKDKVWYICALQDGSVTGPGYEYKIKYKYEKTEHKLIVNRAVNPVEFKVADYQCYDEDKRWRMARIGEVLANMHKVQDVLYDRAWDICALVDGSVAGPGYNYDVKNAIPKKELGRKLLIKGGVQTPEAKFSVFNISSILKGHWRMARIGDVMANMEKVKKVLENKECHICALMDGSIAGPGYDYIIKNEIDGTLQHMLIINY